MTIYLMGVLVSLTSAAADVTVQASVDSMMMWVGQQTGLHLEVTCDPDQRIEFPLFGDTLVTDLEIVPPVLTDTIYLNDGKRMSVTRHYTVTCFDSALIYIAPIPGNIRSEGKPWCTCTVLGDPASIVALYSVYVRHSECGFPFQTL